MNETLQQITERFHELTDLEEKLKYGRAMVEDSRPMV